MSLTIYKASAGSGKTFTLSATYIAHLLADDDDQPHKHQLAVTFTNKATGEMKERILQYLYSIGMGTDDNDGFFKAVRAAVPERITNRMMRQKARRALLSIIHDYDHFHVTTIDSFFQSLLSSLAHELNLSANFKVEISDKEVISKAVDRIIANLEEGSAELGWITEYIKERLDDDKHWNVAEELKTLGKEITKETYMLHSHLLNANDHKGETEGIVLDNKTLGAYKMLMSKTIAEECKAIADKALAVDNLITASLGYDQIAYGKNRVMPFIVKAKELDAHKPLPVLSPSFRAYASGETHLLSKANQKKSALCAEAESIVPLLDALVQQFDVSSAYINSCRLSRANLNPLRLLDAIDKEVRVLNLENDRMLLAYTPLLFHKLSKDNDASFVFERAGIQYKHVMIDEFQDTSKLQWENMRMLLLENMAQGNSCMLVGDVKQGIYRFRGGDWNALAGFDEGYDEALHSSIKIETLKTNFRSGEGVVDFNNQLFTSAPQVVQQRIEEAWGTSVLEPEGQSQETEHLNIERIYPTPGDPDNHEVTQLPHDKGGFVRIQLLNNETEAQKKERKKAEKAAQATSGESADADAETFSVEASVAEQMMRLHAEGVPYSEMAILVRGKNDPNPLMKYFEEHHGSKSEHPIALMSEEAFLLESSPAVMTIVNALRYVSNPSDKIAFEYVVRRLPEGRTTDELRALLDLWNKEKYCGLPFYEVSCRLANFFELHRQEGQSPYIYFFLDAVLSYIEDHSADIKAFLQHWDETLCRKSIPSAAVDGVRILTIHKSKGLAFHSVFIPYCEWPIEQHPELLWTQPAAAPFNNIPILPVVMNKDAGNSIYRNVYKQEMFDKYVENLNLLYVAFTRTRQNLLVWANCKKGGIATVLRDALGTEDEILEFGTPSALGVSKPSESEPAHTPGEDAESAQQTTSKEKQAEPLNYETSPIFINFTHYDPQLVFRQSTKAKEFFAPESAEKPEQRAEETQESTVHAESQDASTASTKAAAQEEYRKTGILLHDLMSTIESLADVDCCVEEAARQGLLPVSLSIDSVKKLIGSRINHPTARVWFDGSWTLYRECSIIFQKDGKTITRRPDRVMTRGNKAEGTDETIVIDFKFGKFKTEHREQVKEYMELMGQQGRHNVRGYLWYIYSGSIEEVV